MLISYNRRHSLNLPMEILLMVFWYMTGADVTAFRSAFDVFISHHYENQRERANAIALSGEKELLTTHAMQANAIALSGEKELPTTHAMHQHAKKLNAALGSEPY